MNKRRLDVGMAEVVTDLYPRVPLDLGTNLDLLGSIPGGIEEGMEVAQGRAHDE